MSSSSSSGSGYAQALASSSRTPPSTSPANEDYSDDGLDIQDSELLADDPLHEDGVPNAR